MKILNTLNEYFYHFRKFGKSGINYYSQLTSGKEIIEAKIRGFEHPIFLRNKTSDIATFDQVIKHKEYKFNYWRGVDVILDLGANIGLASIYYKSLFPNATIIAVEPDQSNYELLVKNTERYKNIICIKAGVWHKPTRLKIIDENASKWSFITLEDPSGNIETISIEQIISSYSLTKIDIIKMDIESAEKEVFEAGISKWSGITKMLILELHDRYKPGCSKAVFTELVKYNFSTTFRGENICVVFD